MLVIEISSFPSDKQKAGWSPLSHRPEPVEKVLERE